MPVDPATLLRLTVTAITIHYEPAPIQLGGNMDPGAEVRIVGFSSGEIRGVVVDSARPGALGALEDDVDPDLHPTLHRIARLGAEGKAGSIAVDLADFLPW